MQKEIQEGIYSAIFSVYDEKLNVKKTTVEKMVDYQLKSGIKGFYVGGATGECVVLPAKTKKQMYEATVEANKGRGQIIAHVGAGHYDETLELLDCANNLDVDAVSSLPPSLMGYYNANEIITYYKELAKKSKHPVYVYINPYVASVVNAKLLDFAKEMAKIDNLAGMKITVSDYYSFGKVTAAVGDRLKLFNGADECTICGLSIGAYGAIGTTYNLIPKVGVELFNKFKANDMAGALKEQRKINDIVNIALGLNISRWKDILGLLDFDMGYTVFPGQTESEEDVKKLKSDLEKVGFFDMV